MRILVLGGTGFVGKHLQQYVKNSTDTWDFIGSQQCDLQDIEQLDNLVKNGSYDYIVNLAAKVGGINANSTRQFQFFMENNLLGQNIFNISVAYNIPTLSLLSTCCFEDLYHSMSRTKAKKHYPLDEKYVLSGQAEQSNEGYAQAKRNMATSYLMANKHFGQNHKMLVPCNIMGEYDHFDLSSGHFVASLIKKVFDATSEIEVWGDGTPLRQFIHADSLCEVIVHFIYNWSKINDEIVNVCPDYNYTIKEMVDMVVDISGKQLKVKYNKTKPNGIYRKDGSNKKLKKIMNVDFGDMKEHLRKIYEYYANNQAIARINN